MSDLEWVGQAGRMSEWREPRQELIGESSILMHFILSFLRCVMK
jgi:hypothetical protein